ncbi:MAG: hypothetical protein M0P71_12400 [Melioribacteraceae bacterium]|nr:hypothetical protein [Melioribacteraceae bacterium]
MNKRKFIQYKLDVEQFLNKEILINKVSVDSLIILNTIIDIQSVGINNILFIKEKEEPPFYLLINNHYYFNNEKDKELVIGGYIINSLSDYIIEVLEEE